MSDFQITFIGILLPFAGTTVGAATVYLLSKQINTGVQKLLVGFASGVMIAASVWSLLLPAIDMSSESGSPEWLPAVIGFLVGMGFLLVLDLIIPHLHNGANAPEGAFSHFKKTAMLVFAVTLHNIPEGMAVGVVFDGLMNGSAITRASAIALSVGIALQNFPEGAIISMPLKAAGMSKNRAFVYGMLSGIVEPVAAVLTVLLTALVAPALPYILAFAAGAMIYVVVEELIPEASADGHSNLSTVGVALGFALMMFLDVTLG